MAEATGMDPGLAGRSRWQSFLENTGILRAVREVLLYGTLLALPVAAIVAYAESKAVQAVVGANITLGISAAIGLLLTAVPILIATVQTTSIGRQKAKLDSLVGTPLAGTLYFQAARRSLDALRPPRIFSGDYFAPMMLFGVTLLFSALLVTLAPQFLDEFKRPNLLLGGIKLVDGSDGDGALAGYQKGTFLCASMAFVGSYVYVLARLLDRVNNNDIYPISFHYYGARFITASLVAAVFRHCLAWLGLEANQVIVPVGFVVGLTPDLAITYIARRLWQQLKIAGDRPDPDPGAVPSALNLLMIDGLTRDKIDRLGELSIDNAQVLARQNPLILWPRLPYDLGLIVDWIAQAQLYTMVRETTLRELRGVYVTDIFDFHDRLTDEAARGEVASAIGLSPASAAALGREIEGEPSFRRLRQVRAALRPDPQDGEA
jgi:hypothetical protein